MNQQREAAEAEYAALNALFVSGDIALKSKADLERLAIVLSRPNAPIHFGGASYPQICETVRSLLLVRMSEEQNEQAKRESRLALVISGIALLAGLVQAVASLWPLLATSPTLVQADRPLPIQAPQPIGGYLISNQPTNQAPHSKSPPANTPRAAEAQGSAVSGTAKQ